MIDGPTSAVIVSAILGTAGSIITAIVKLAPGRGGDGALETRVAVVENNFQNLSGTLVDLRNEIHELRRELKDFRGGR